MLEWVVEFHDEFDPEYEELDSIVQDELLAHLQVLEKFGPQLGRPHVDTLNGSRYANMKELRFNAAHGVWRFAFAFDPKRQAVILCGGDKSGTSEMKFYRNLIRKADERFASHIAKIESEKRKEWKRGKKS
jgi:hypothetical protein